MEYKICVYFYTLGAIICSLALGGYFVAHSVVKDIGIHLDLISGYVENKKNQIQILEPLTDFINAHSHAEQLSVKS